MATLVAPEFVEQHRASIDHVRVAVVTAPFNLTAPSKPRSKTFSTAHLSARLRVFRAGEDNTHMRATI
jgi:hypothetical protein